eukprot:jgi/Mesvir1/4954/Mv04575-RA.1
METAGARKRKVEIKPEPEHDVKKKGSGPSRNATFSRSRVKLIAVYNFKGGVGKTSTAINLGGALNQLGRRVCYVDCDSQCNLSSFFNPDPEREDAAPELIGEPPEAQPGVTLRSHHLNPQYPDFRDGLCAQGFTKADGTAYEFSIKTVMRASMADRTVSTNLVHLAEEGGHSAIPAGLFLLPGDAGFHDVLEAELVNAYSCAHLGDSSQFVKLGSFRKALLDIGEANEIDYFICDFGPSSDTVNKLLLLSCDYILPPFQPDFFSASSVYGLINNVLPSMRRMHDFLLHHEAGLAELKDPGHAAYKLKDSFPKIFPFLMVNYGLRKKLILRFDSGIFHLVYRVLHNHLASIPAKDRELFCPDPMGDHVIPFLRDVPAALKVAHQLGHPAYLLKASVLEAAGVNNNLPTGYEIQRSCIVLAFNNLARFIVQTCEAHAAQEA